MQAWQQLVTLSNEELGSLDIAEVNLACAAGLPDAGDIDISICQHRLDYWSRMVRQETDRLLPHFHRKQRDYRNSEGYFRILVMVTVLQRDCGVCYNPEKIDESVPLESRDIFLHGITQGSGGTCASLPVVYVAIGRRLGYPLKLVRARTQKWGHVFVRWDAGGGERFNIEATSRGLHSDPDEHYRNGVYRITPAEERAGCLLQSLTPRQELAGFMAERGQRWLDFKRYRRAVEGFAWARALHPENVCYRTMLARLMDDWDEDLQRRKPPRFPTLDISWPPRRYPEVLPEVIERGIIEMEATENLLNTAEFEHNWWGPLRQRRPVPAAPVLAMVRCELGHLKIRFKFLAEKARHASERS